MKKAMIIYILISVAVLVMAIILIPIHKNKYDKADEKKVPQTVTVKGVDTYGDPFGDDDLASFDKSGDKGSDGVGIKASSGELNTMGKKASQDTMINLAVKYNKSIPYCLDGMDESMAFEYAKASDGVDNFALGDLSHGMNGLGYVKWLFRNTFGTYPVELDDPENLKKNSKIISTSDLNVGDIGISCSDTGTYRVGVCIGYYNGFPLFTYCWSIPTKLYPAGTNHISFLKQTNDCYFNSSPPVSFDYFIRPENTWEK